jgi:D-alanine-D-alanine ligase
MKIKVDPDWWKDLFDDVYLCTDARSVCNTELTRREVDLIQSLLPIEKHHRILDLCGGHGRHSLELCVRGFDRCFLLDYSTTLVAHARDSARNLQLNLGCHCGDARMTGFSEVAFDHVLILGNSLGYSVEPGADHMILTEAHRLLRPGGWVLVDITDGVAVRARFRPNAWHEIGDDILVCRDRELLGDRVHAREVVVSKQAGLIRDRTYSIRLYDRDSLEDLLHRAGFEESTVITDFSLHQEEGDFGFMNHRMVGVGRKP